MEKRTLKNMKWGNKELPEEIENLSLAKLAASNAGTIAHSNPESKEKILKAFRQAAINGGKANKGVRKSNIENYVKASLSRPDSHNKKIAESLKGQKLTEERKAKISEAIKNNPKIACPHCGKESDPRNYSRWHGDNCKKKGA